MIVLLDHNGKEIRLPEERWKHINERHPETKDQEEQVKETMAAPDLIQEGVKEELLAIRRFKRTPISENKYCVVVYKPRNGEGFVITAYFTRRPSFRRKLLWRK